jgi:uncharacterized protein YoxC
MPSQRKVKLLILSAILVFVALVCGIVFQLVKINQIDKRIQQQEKEIEQLQQDIDSFNKQPDKNDEYYDVIIGGGN